MNKVAQMIAFFEVLQFKNFENSLKNYPNKLNYNPSHCIIWNSVDPREDIRNTIAEFKFATSDYPEYKEKFEEMIQKLEDLLNKYGF